MQVAYVSKSLYGNIVDDVNEHLKNMEAFLENMLNAPYHPNASIPLREIGECFWGYRDGRKGHWFLHTTLQMMHYAVRFSVHLCGCGEKARHVCVAAKYIRVVV